MPRTVLIVDDERDTNDLLAGLVQARDFCAIQHYSGSSVVDLVREHQPDLVLLDLTLPETDGFVLCEQLKRNRDTNLIPIILMAPQQDGWRKISGVRWSQRLAG